VARRCSKFYITIFYDSRRRYIDLDLHKNTYVVGTLKDLKPYVGTQVADLWCVVITSCMSVGVSDFGAEWLLGGIVLCNALL